MMIQIIDKSQHDWHGMTVFYFNKKSSDNESELLLIYIIPDFLKRL